MGVPSASLVRARETMTIVNLRHILEKSVLLLLMILSSKAVVIKNYFKGSALTDVLVPNDNSIIKIT